MIWMVVVVEVDGAGDLVETSWLVDEAVFGLGAGCSAFAFFAGAPFETGSVACCTFLFAMLN
jgi:hypothetical protein